MKTEIKKSHLEQFIRYDPETGHIFWVKRSGKKRAGDRVGSKHSRGYVEMRVDGIRMFAHQAAWVLMTGNWPDHQIDHKNGLRDDNRWSNLRKAEQPQNSANMRRRSNNKSGMKGVVEVRPGRWTAFIHIDRRTKYLGTYRCPQIAHRAYLMAARFAWGDFARAE